MWPGKETPMAEPEGGIKLSWLMPLLLRGCAEVKRAVV
jgi:hypothetical protein